MTLSAGQFSLNGVVLDGSPSSGATYRLVNPDFLNHQVRAKDVDRPFAHGSVLGRDYLQGRTFTFDVIVKAPAGAQLYAAISALSEAWTPNVDGLDTLSFCLSDGYTLAAYGRPRRFAADLSRAGVGHAKASLEFVSPYAFFQGGGHQHSTTPLVTPAGLTLTPGTYAGDGHPGPGGLDLDDGTYAGDGHPGPGGISFIYTLAATGQIQATNHGNFDAPYLVTFTGPLTNPTLVAPDGELSLGVTLTSGQAIVFDSSERSVTEEGVSRYSWVNNADWFTIPPGTPVPLRFFTDTQADTGTVTVQYADTFI